MNKRATIAWQPFSAKHKQYIRRGIKADMSVAEGAIRSGKTIDNCIIAAAHLETCPDKIHLASGSTLGNAKLNIGDCNGFGLEHIFRGRCRWGKYKDNPSLKIMTQTGEKIVIFAGAKNVDAYKKILGNSYGLWIATEINEHYDSDNSKESFVKVAQGRQVAAKQPKTLWDLNPSNPHANIYSEYIDRYRQEYAGEYNYQLFTLHDNLTITPRRMEIIESMYTPGTVWYNRDILGQRVVAEGLVYPYLADDASAYMEELEFDNKGKCKEKFSKITIGIDYGGNKSMTTFTATGFRGYDKLILLEEYGLPISEKIDATMIEKAFVDFEKMIAEKYGAIAFAFGDNASPTMNNQLSASARRNMINIRVTGCDKFTILRRAQLIDAMLTQGRMKFRKGTRAVVGALSTLCWDDKTEDEIEDKNLGNCNDWFDSFGYSFSTYLEKLERGY